MDDDKNKKKWSFNVPLPGINSGSGPPGPNPRPPRPPDPPAKPQPKRKWQPGSLPTPQTPQASVPDPYAGHDHAQADPVFNVPTQGDQTVESVLPIFSDQPQEDARPQLAVQERNRVWWLPLLGFAVVGGFVLIASLGILEQPLSHLMQAQSYARQQAMIEAQRRAEYQALDAEVRGAVRQVQKSLVNLDIQAQDLAADAELRVGQPIQRLQSHPRERPRELDLAILESKDTAANWASLTNAVCRPPEANPVYQAVQEVDNRMRDGKLMPSDRHLAAGLVTLTTQQETQAVKRYGHVRRLTESLEARRFELLLDSVEGSK